MQQLQKWRDQLLLALTVLLPALDQADCSGFCGRAMLRNKWLENTLGQRVDWFVHFKLKHILEKSKTDFFFFKATISLPTGEVIMRKEALLQNQDSY